MLSPFLTFCEQNFIGHELLFHPFDSHAIALTTNLLKITYWNFILASNGFDSSTQKFHQILQKFSV